METKEQTLVWETLNDEQIRESIAEIGLGEQLGMFDQIDALNTILRCRRDIAALRAARDALAEALHGCIDSLEYVQANMPGFVGFAVRAELIYKARTALAQARGEKGAQ